MKRNANFELFRIIAMMMITISHLLGQGGVFMHTTLIELKIAIHLIEAVCNVAVNYFILLAGFFLIKASVPKLIKLCLQMQFYSILVELFVFVNWGSDKSILFIIKESIFPVLSNQWWYMTSYVVLFLLSPILNRILESAPRMQLKHGLQLSLLLFSIFPTCSQLLGQPLLFGNMGDGFTLGHFILMYCLGYYVAHYEQHWPRGGCLIAYIGSTAVIWIINVCRDINGQSLWYTYNNIFIIMQAVTFLILIKSCMPFSMRKGDYINRIAGLTLAVYLLSNHKLLREWLYVTICKTDQFYDTFMQIPILLISTLCIMTICMVFEAIRQSLERKLKVSERVTRIILSLKKVQKFDIEYFS